MFSKSLRVILAATALVSVALSARVQDFAMADSDEFTFESQLVDAANQNNFSIVKLLLQQGANPNEKGRFETTALQRAAYNGYGNVIDLLIAGGADLNEKDFGGATALHMAGRQGSEEVVNKLIKAGANIDIKDNEGYTPLHRAVAAGNYSVAKILLSARANPNSSSSGGDTPLVDAVRSGDSRLVSLLNSYGADRSGTNASGKSAVDYAIASGNKNISAALTTENKSQPVYNGGSNIQAGPALSSAQNRRAPVAAVEEITDPLISGSQKNLLVEQELTQELTTAANNVPSYEIPETSDSANIEIPAVVLPNSERAKKIAENKLPWEASSALPLPTSPSNEVFDELLPTETIAQQPRPTPQNGFEQLFTDTVARTEQASQPTEVMVSSQQTRLNNNSYELKSSDNISSERPRSMQYTPPSQQQIAPVQTAASLPNEIEPSQIAYNNVSPASQNVKRDMSQDMTSQEIQIEPTEIRENLDFTDYSSAQYKPINFVPERTPAKILDDNGLPASFKYRKSNLSYQTELSGSGYNGTPALPEFNYQNYQSEELFTTPVQSLQIINLATKETLNKKLEDPKTGYSNNLQSIPVSAPNYKAEADNVSLPASMRKVGTYNTTPSYNISPNVSANIASSTYETAPATQLQAQPIANDNYYPNNDMSVPASMSSAYKNIGKPKSYASAPVYQPRNNPVENIYSQNQPNYMDEMKPVPVAGVEIGSEEMVDVAMNHIANQPASAETRLPPEYGNLPKENPTQANNLISSIQTFYNGEKEYPSAPQSMGNLNITAPRYIPGNSYQPNNYQAGNSQNMGMDSLNVPNVIAPSPQRNLAGGPKSLQLWNNVSESKRATLYNKITQQNAPVYTEPKAAKSSYVADNYNASSANEEVSVSIEPANDNTSAIGSDNVKVPEVAVQEETIENLNNEIPDEIANISNAAPSSDLVSAEEIKREEAGIPAPSAINPSPGPVNTEAPIPTAPPVPEPALPITPTAETSNDVIDVPEMPSFDAPDPAAQIPALSPVVQAPTEQQSANLVSQETTVTEPVLGDVVDYKPATDDVDLTGTHSVIGGFETIEKATDYFNGISLRLGLLYNYKIAQSKETGKFYVAVGKLEDSDSANKVCEVYKSEEVTCEVYVNLSYGSKKLSDLSLIESKKVYAMIGEFQTADQADAFFQQYSAKYKVDYKIAQNSDNNMFVLQIGPVFNGGDGKKICDDMKNPEIKCRVALK